jgi:arabinose-5-phosphate isomerase
LEKNNHFRIGKSEIIGQKIAAPLTSIGKPSIFFHPTETLHQDLGIYSHGDESILILRSSETDEFPPFCSC